MCSGGRVDHGHHYGRAHLALNETLALSDAVDTVLETSDTNDTLVILTADHSHTLSISGYPYRHTDVYSK